MPAPTRSLPRKPNLEQLRKQARELLDRYRTGDPAAIAEVQQFEQRPEPGAFALADAQRILARAYGYASWPRLKAFVDGVNVARLAEAVNAGDLARVRALLRARPELAGMEMSGGDEHRALHYAVLRRDAAIVRALMEAGADARAGIFPHRDATTALALSRDRGYDDIVAIIEAEEQSRRQAGSCPNAAVSPVQDQITAAIRRGDSGEAMRLLAADPSLARACDRQGGTPLHVAAECCDAELSGWLLAHGANPSKTDLRGDTPLDRAALAFDPRHDRAETFAAIAQMLQDHGAEVTLAAAVALDDAARVRELLAANPGALREITWRGGGLLTVAVEHGRLEMVRLLLDLGADPDERTILEQLEEPTPSWGSPLWHAAQAGHYEIAELLLDRGADPNANLYASGWPLWRALQHGQHAVAQLLRERGARPTPYMVGESNDVEEAKRLLAGNPSEDALRDMAHAAGDAGCPDVLRLVLPQIPWPRNDSRWEWILIQPPRGIEADGRDHEAAFACMEILLQHGVDPNATNGHGQTVMNFVAARPQLTGPERARFAGMLIDAGARLDLRDHLLQSTPLGWACRWGRTEMVRLLLDRGAPAQEPDAAPWATPLAWATKMGHAGIADLLTKIY